MSWKFPGKLLCITLFFTSYHWYNIVVYFTKKNAFQSTKIFRRIQWQNMLRMHLLQSRISKFSGGEPLYPPPTREGGKPPSRTLPHSGSPPLGSCLRHSTLPLLYKLRLLLQFFLRTLQSFWIIKFSTSGIVHFGQLREINYLSIGENREKIIRVGFL